jgi:hemerythrin
MPFIEWSSELSVRVDEMDRQHKQLVELLNQLHNAMKSGKGKDVVGQTLASLVKYTNTHFGAEEQFMQKTGYPDLQAQKLSHEAFVKKVQAFESSVKAGETLQVNEVLNFLWGWLKTHIQKEDRKYGEYAASKSPVASKV